ncbi:MAG: hypothetical protein HYR85_01535 [Planctomycetes bacterium]|nr:hypothetical protein [Planctomycetota bacterium]
MIRPRSAFALVVAASAIASAPSAARATTTAIGPYEHGSIALDLETGARSISPICEEDSEYRVTASHEHQLVRGVAEFQLPALPADYSRATLFLWETREVVVAPRPAETHFVSFYAADLSVGVADFDRPSIVLEAIETDANESLLTFRIDVSPLVADFANGNLGFRVQLADEAVSEERDAAGDAGSRFAAWIEIESSAPPGPHVVFDAVPSWAPPVVAHAGRSVVAAVVLGGADFDVRQVDSSSVRLLGVPATAWRVRDMATPMPAVNGAVRSQQSSDGFADLLLCFDSHEVAVAARHLLGRRPTAEDTIPMLFTARLQSAFGGASVAVEDRVSLAAR